MTYFITNAVEQICCRKLVQPTPILSIAHVFSSAPRKRHRLDAADEVETVASEVSSKTELEAAAWSSKGVPLVRGETNALTQLQVLVVTQT